MSGLVLTPLLQLTETDRLPEFVPGVLTYVLAIALVTIIPEALKKSPRQSTIGVFWAFVGVYFVFAGFHAPAIHTYLNSLSADTRTVLAGACLLVFIVTLVLAFKKRKPVMWILIAPALGAAAVFAIDKFDPNSSGAHALMDFAMALCSLYIAARLRPGDESP